MHGEVIVIWFIWLIWFLHIPAISAVGVANACSSTAAPKRWPNSRGSSNCGCGRLESFSWTSRRTTSPPTWGVGTFQPCCFGVFRGARSCKVYPFFSVPRILKTGAPELGCSLDTWQLEKNRIHLAMWGGIPDRAVHASSHSAASCTVEVQKLSGQTRVVAMGCQLLQTWFEKCPTFCHFVTWTFALARKRRRFARGAPFAIFRGEEKPILNPMFL